MQKTLNLALTLFTLVLALPVQSAEFNFGPRIGFGVGSVSGPGNLGEEEQLSINVPLGFQTQFKFENMSLDLGLLYVNRADAFVDERDTDGDNDEDDVITTFVTRSIELPVTIAYNLNLSNGFWKFGGGLAPSFKVGKAKVDIEDFDDDDNSGDTKVSYDDLDLKTFDLLLLFHIAYQFQFTSWDLSLDLHTKVGLIDQIKTSNDTWRNISTEFSVGFLF